MRLKALEDEADEAVAVLGRPSLAEILDECTSKRILATVIIVEDAEDVEQRRLARPRSTHD